MRKRSLLLAAALSALFVLPLAACKNTAPFDVDDYALPLDSEYLSKNAFADKTLPGSTTMFQGSLYQAGTNSRLITTRITDNSDVDYGTYRLYDTVTREYIGDQYAQQYINANGFYIMGSNRTLNGPGIDVWVFSPSGQWLVGDGYANSLYDSTAPKTSTFYAYVNGVEKQILSVTYIKSSTALSYYYGSDYDSGAAPDYDSGEASDYDSGEASDYENDSLPTTTQYYTYNSKTETYTQIEEKSFSLLPIGSTVGSQVVATNVTHLGADTDKGERPTSLDGWSVFGSGNTATFMNTYGLKNELVTQNVAELGTLKNYFLYYEMERVDSSAKNGYNVVFETNTSSNSYSLKYKATLYRYDIIKGEKKKLNCDYFIADFSDKLYSNTAHDFDKAIVTGYEFHGGVAVVSSDNRATELIINEDASVCLDLSTKTFSLDGEILKLRNNRYFCDNTIFDKDLNVISSLSGASVYKNQSLIVSSTNNGRKFAVDFNGKIVLAPVYSSLDFYGDYALTSIYEASGTKTNYIVSKNNPNGTSVFSLTGTSESSSVNTNNGLLVVTQTSGTDLYSFDGTRLIAGLSSSYTITPVRGGYVVNDEELGGSYLIY